MRYIIIPPLGEPTIEEGDLDLRKMQQIVEGWVQYIDIAPDVAMIVDEEGVYHGRPNNKKATDIVHKVRPKEINMYNGNIYGTVIIIGQNHDLEDTSVPDHFIDTMKRIIG